MQTSGLPLTIPKFLNLPLLSGHCQKFGFDFLAISKIFWLPLSPEIKELWLGTFNNLCFLKINLKLALTRHFCQPKEHSILQCMDVRFIHDILAGVHSLLLATQMIPSKSWDNNKLYYARIFIPVTAVKGLPQEYHRIWLLKLHQSSKNCSSDSWREVLSVLKCLSDASIFPLCLRDDVLSSGRNKSSSVTWLSFNFSTSAMTLGPETVLQGQQKRQTGE